MEKRPDWDRFVAHLPQDANAAAQALDAYRAANGLPLEFVVKDSATAARHGLHATEEEMSAAYLVTVFMNRMPESRSFLESSPVYEFDAQGKIIREWAIPVDVDYWRVVEGVAGDELITEFRGIDRNVFLYFKPDGSYRVSATPPSQDEPAQWIDVGDSTFLHVGGGLANENVRHTASFFNAQGVARMTGKTPPKEVDVGKWVAGADSGWYVRLDTVPGLPVRAHVMTFDEPGTHPGAKCPEDKRTEGMICTSFPSPGGRRMLAYPTPIT